ncbi:protein TIC 62, chloroplastic [Cornus florida]|uniref:protein TIC 62, chloroplastic n=1 Tax=Cornus florida TaxID=4283 RepID=UPI00289B377C|nr:protein TIC 62, chloroplastic [Cornus florida]
MEIHSLQSSTVTRIPSALTPFFLREKPFLSGQVIKIPNSKRHLYGRTIKLLDFRVQASGTTKFSSEATEGITKDANLKVEDLVFVAGGTGRVGSRTVRELLKLGFRVRAGVRSAQRAESLVQSVQQMKFGIEVTSEGSKPTEKLEIVECDLEKQDQIGPALGNSSIIICCIGASEKEVFDITGPYRIDYQATKNLIDAATVAKVNHFILLTSLGTNKVGFPAAILNLFWGVLIWKRKAEEALLASGLPYTIVRPGGMERPTDAYKETHNVTLSEEDTLFGGQVSNLQVAELMAFMAKNRSLSYCKVVEVIAETTAPLTPMGELLVKIPSQRAEAYPLKESFAADGPGPAVSKGVASETPSTPIKKEPANVKAVPTRPLSPYIVYDDLKPPTSPSPNAPTFSLPSMSTLDGGSQIATVSGNSTAHTASADKPGDEQHSNEAKGRPLSPFTMYEDMKPPTSPMPSPRK